ncbi:MAG: phosphodiester glycosidase family protein [Bacilli bacterium]|nr:phosphodiester glycosidase family protein [Bacilli bacterium]
MKKTIKFIWLILAVFVSLVLPLSKPVFGEEKDITTTGGAGYYIRERITQDDLGHEISHYTDLATTIRGNVEFSQQVNVLEVPTATNAKIINYANLRNNRWTLTSVRSLAERFEEENPEWKVIAAVNGDFFDINGVLNGLPYQTHNPVVTQGEFYKTTVRTNVLGFTNDGSTNTLISGGKNIRTQFIKLAVYDDNDMIIAEFDVEKINEAPGNDETAVFFGYYDDDHHYIPKAVPLGGARGFFIETAELALPNNQNDFYGKGVISTTKPITLERGQFAIVTNSSQAASVLDIGVKVRTQFEFTGPLSMIDNATGYQGKFLEKSEYLESTVSVLQARHPRTTVGVRADGTIVMAVIDGRQAVKGMEGVYGDEMAAIMKKYDCTDAYNLDGGGSSTMLIRKDGEFVVVNSPSDGRERSDANCLLLAVRMPQIDYRFIQTEDTLTLFADLIAANNHDIKELYIELNGESRRIDSEEVTFSGLERNTEYYYIFKYRNSKGVLNTLFVDGRIKTLKRSPSNLRFTVYEHDLFFQVTFYYDDPDYASRLTRAYINVNGREVLAIDGQVVLTKQMVGTRLDTLSINYIVNLNDGERVVEQNISDYLLTSSAEIAIILGIVERVEGVITGIYR